MTDPSIYDAANFLIAVAALFLNYLRYRDSKSRTRPRVGAYVVTKMEGVDGKVFQVEVHNRSTAYLAATGISSPFFSGRIFWPRKYLQGIDTGSFMADISTPKIKQFRWSSEMAPDGKDVCTVYAASGQKIIVNFEWPDTGKRFTQSIRLP